MELHDTHVAPPRTRNLLIGLLACVVALGVVAVVVVLVLRSVLAPAVTASETDFGTCPASGAPCSDVPASTIERVSGVSLPAGSKVLGSEAVTHSALNDRRYVTAWVQVPEGSLATLRTGHGEGDPAWTTPRDGIGNVFSDYNAEVTSFDDEYGTTLALGETSTGKNLLWVHTTLPVGNGHQ